MGTKFWKSSSVDGVEVETRLLEKVAPADDAWRAISYIARADGSDAEASEEGMVDVLGTDHDVPAAKECFGCHAGTSARILGFSAVQLADLDRWSRSGVLTVPFDGPLMIPGNERTQQALGYLHANCAHCHNQRRPKRTGKRCWDPKAAFDRSLRTDQLERLEQTPVYRTAVGEIISPGIPDDSALFTRMQESALFRPRMPPLATELRDERGMTVIRTWVEGLRTTGR